MSRNGSGTYNLPAGNPVVTATTITSTWANTTLSDIGTALTGSLAADGQTPATGNLNMNNNKVTALATPTVSTDAVTKAYADALVVGNGTMASQNANNVAITGGTINGTTIGATTASTGKFTDLTASGDVSFTSTGGLQIPVGTTAQRPAAPVNGDIRYNTTRKQYEGFTTIAAQTTITTITNVTTTATATTAANHNMQTGDYVTITGCTPSSYNGSFSITVTASNAFTYVMLTNPGGSATVIGTYTNGIWTQIGGGATGSGTDQIFNLNGNTVTASYTIPTGYNANTTGTLTINTGVVVTVSTGSRWVIL
jgi:hypothetical protein